MVFQVFSNVVIFIKNRKTEKRLNEVEKEKTEMVRMELKTYLRRQKNHG